jgi:hypothetical protein
MAGGERNDRAGGRAEKMREKPGHRRTPSRRTVPPAMQSRRPLHF